MTTRPQTFWRYQNKPHTIHTRHVIAHKAEPGTTAHVRQLMQDVAAAAVAAGFARPLFPFAASDVEAIYTAKRDEGTGVWFALHDGRVFNSFGELDSGDPNDYAGTP